jgi:hypothetical protein
MDRDRDRRYVPDQRHLVPVTNSTSLQHHHNNQEADFIPLTFSPDSRDRYRDRDRGRDYDRDRDVERMGRGESYRPGRSEQRERSPIRDRDRDNYRRPPPSDSYIPSRSGRPRSRSPRRSPPTYRRRSRTRSPPPRRFRDDSRDRPRSPPPPPPPPPRRPYSPPPRRDDDRRDTRARSPAPRDSGRYERSPPPRFRDRSPAPLKRTRDPSPYRERGYRSPPPKRERHASPRRPERYAAFPPVATRNFPRLTFCVQVLTINRSPPRQPYSPPPRDDPEDRGYRRHSRSPPPRRNDDRFEPRRPRSPSPRRPSGPASASTTRRSSPFVGDDRPIVRVPSEFDLVEFPTMNPERRNGIPTGPSSRNGAPTGPRAPPSGPSSTRTFSQGPPPTGPQGLRVNSMSVSILSAPSRPRGRGGFHPSGPSRDFSGGIPVAPRRASDYSVSTPPSFPSGPPSGPRGSIPGSRPPPFRGSSNSTSTTYPRTLRFQNQLADTNAIVPGGKKVDYRNVAHSSKIRKLEEDMERLRQEIAERERASRKVVADWDRLGTEAERALTRAEFVEENMRTIDAFDTHEDAMDHDDMADVVREEVEV